MGYEVPLERVSVKDRKQRMCVTIDAPGSTRVLRVHVVRMWCVVTLCVYEFLFFGVLCERSYCMEPSLHEAAKNGDLRRVAHILARGANPNRIDRWYHTTPLHLATRAKHDDIVEALLVHRADPNLADMNGRTALHEAAMSGCHTIVMQLLHHGARNSVCDIDGWQPLHHAVALGHTKAARVLVENGCPLEVAGYDGLRPLHVAVIGGNYETVELLLNKGGNCDAQMCHPHSSRGFLAMSWGLRTLEGISVPAGFGHCGETPLLRAVTGGHLRIAQLLIERGADVNNVGAECTMGPLLRAVERSDSAMVSLLLHHGANTRSVVRDFTRESALHLASRHGEDSIVRLLIEYGAVINTTDRDGHLPLHVAAMYGRTSVVRVLLDEAKVRGLVLDRHLAHALRIAITNGHEASADILVRHGADTNALGLDCHTPLLVEVAGCGSRSLLETFLRHGALLSARDARGRTALWMAIKRARAHNVRVLVAYGATLTGDSVMSEHARAREIIKELHKKNEPACVEGTVFEGSRVLLDYVLNVFKESIHFLARVKSDSATAACACAFLAKRLTHGFAVTANVRDGHGMTPLHYATARAQTAEGKNDDWARIAHILVARHADVNARDVHGNTPLHHALCNRNEVLASLLIRYGADVSASNDCGTPALMMWSAFARHIVMSLAGHHGAAAMAGGTLGRS